jgi:hypothetical protein
MSMEPFRLTLQFDLEPGDKTGLCELVGVGSR